MNAINGQWSVNIVTGTLLQKHYRYYFLLGIGRNLDFIDSKLFKD
jgi:hypothetical protein